MVCIAARRRVERRREDVYAQLAHLRGHWRLAGRWVQPIELNDGGGVVRVRGPLGLRRTIHTELTDLRPHHRVAGEARSGGTRAAISWSLEDDGEASHVTLRAEVLAASTLDRVLLTAGGRRWMQRRFVATLKRLG